MNDPVHPLIRRLCLAADAAPAAARRLQPADPPLRRFETSLDRLLVVSVASRIEALTEFSGGHPALAQKLTALETTTSDAPSTESSESRRPGALPRPVANAPAPRRGPRPIPADRIADTTRALHQPPRLVPPPPERVAQAWRARIATRAASLPAWESPLPPPNARPVPMDHPAHDPQLPGPSPFAVLEASPRLNANSESRHPAARTGDRPNLESQSDSAGAATGYDSPAVLGRGDHRLEQVLQRLGMGGPGADRSRAINSAPPSIQPAENPTEARATTAVGPERIVAAASLNTPPLRGLRALAALGERLDAEPARTAPHFDGAAKPLQARRPAGHDSHPSEEHGFASAQDLAHAMEEILRREVLRHGIDPRQGFA